MIRNIIKLIILISLLFGLPIIGAILSGQQAEKYLEFPPMAHYVQHAPFSWTAFIILTILISIIILPFLTITARRLKLNPVKMKSKNKIPWWGKSGILSMIFFWIIAWGPFDSIGEFQIHTFPFLWLSYIIIINSLQYRKTGRCIMTEQTGKFILLFPISALFWWYFEFSNEFIQNWYYIGADYDRLKFFLLSTVSFSTVLPAVISTSELLLGYTWINEGFKRIWKIKNPRPKLTALIVIIISCSGLFCIGIYPDYFFPMVWLSPFLIVISLQTLFNERHILSDIVNGNWSPFVSAALAALICGVFWEMWNFFSLPKWQYSIPLIQRFHIFEMPVLGYSGYFPFGLLCLAIGEMLGMISSKKLHSVSQ